MSKLPNTPAIMQASWEDRNKQWWTFTGEYASVDFDYFETCGIEMLAGRPFSKSFPSDEKQSVILNEEAARLFGDAGNIGKQIQVLDESKTLIGIVKNFNCGNPNEKPHPAIYTINNRYLYQVVIRIRASQFRSTIDYLKERWNQFALDDAFEVKFADTEIQNLYKAEINFGRLIKMSSIMSIVIACLGLFGLSSFTAEHRKKEIGVRKVMGATVVSIVLLQSREFCVLVLASCIIAWPLAYYFMNKWLQTFVYRIEISAWNFLLSGCIALFIALLTVSYQSIKAARSNPIESLRYE
jgi:putative ABC transport system permease protein